MRRERVRKVDLIAALTIGILIGGIFSSAALFLSKGEVLSRCNEYRPDDTVDAMNGIFYIANNSLLFGLVSFFGYLIPTVMNVIHEVDSSVPLSCPCGSSSACQCSSSAPPSYQSISPI